MVDSWLDGFYAGLYGDDDDVAVVFGAHDTIPLLACDGKDCAYRHGHIDDVFADVARERAARGDL